VTPSWGTVMDLGWGILVTLDGEWCWPSTLKSGISELVRNHPKQKRIRARLRPRCCFCRGWRRSKRLCSRAELSKSVQSDDAHRVYGGNAVQRRTHCLQHARPTGCDARVWTDDSWVVLTFPRLVESAQWHVPLSSRHHIDGFGAPPIMPTAAGGVSLKILGLTQHWNDPSTASHLLRSSTDHRAPP